MHVVLDIATITVIFTVVGAAASVIWKTSGVFAAIKALERRHNAKVFADKRIDEAREAWERRTGERLTELEAWRRAMREFRDSRHD
jgi:hypothetical protein